MADPELIAIAVLIPFMAVLFYFMTLSPRQTRRLERAIENFFSKRVENICYFFERFWNFRQKFIYASYAYGHALVKAKL